MLSWASTVCRVRPTTVCEADDETDILSAGRDAHGHERRARDLHRHVTKGRDEFGEHIGARREERAGRSDESGFSSRVAVNGDAEAEPPAGKSSRAVGQAPFECLECTIATGRAKDRTQILGVECRQPKVDLDSLSRWFDSNHRRPGRARHVRE
jgi:hypothetical protein